MGVPVLVGGWSCVSLLDLDGYESAVSGLCQLLTTCEGEATYPSCVAYVNGRVDGADPAARATWLTYFADNACLTTCTNARVCLDEAPVCGNAAETCAASPYCCGFTDGRSTCEAGACCKNDDAPCVTSEECCNSRCVETDEGTTTCGGEQCKERDEPCVDNSDCCSTNCTESGVCGFQCVGLGATCQFGSDCCSDLCNDGVCDCLADGAMGCADAANCCGLICTDGTCADTSGCSGPGSECNGTGCCEGLECSDDYLACCFSNGSDCPNQPLLCCGQGCEAGACCSTAGNLCADKSECCFDNECFEGRCVHCDQPTCHDLCEPGGPLDAATHSQECANAGFPAAGTSKACIEAVCATPGLEYCCCVGWDDACIAAVGAGQEPGDGDCLIVCPIDATN